MPAWDRNMNMGNPLGEDKKTQHIIENWSACE